MTDFDEVKDKVLSDATKQFKQKYSEAIVEIGGVQGERCVIVRGLLESQLREAWSFVENEIWTPLIRTNQALPMFMFFEK